MGRPKTKAQDGDDEKIVIDESKQLVFANEEELYRHFAKEIDHLEKEFYSLRKKDEDLSEDDFSQFDKNLSVLLDDPDEIWKEEAALFNEPLITYIREFTDAPSKRIIYHVAIVYVTKDVPSFVYIHFPTTDQELVEKYRRGEIIFDQVDQNLPRGALDGDALSENDELAVGLYHAMLKLRSDKDIPEDRFRQFAHFREESIEDADEIWRTNDSMGNVLVNFIRDISSEGEDELFYVVVTVEDLPSNSHALLFSFPTNDKNLVTRYRQGENLQAEEVVQESSH